MKVGQAERDRRGNNEPFTVNDFLSSAFHKLLEVSHCQRLQNAVKVLAAEGAPLALQQMKMVRST